MSQPTTTEWDDERIEQQNQEHEDYAKFMEECAKTCYANDRPCESCQSGGVCDGNRIFDPAIDCGLEDDDLWDVLD